MSAARENKTQLSREEREQLLVKILGPRKQTPGKRPELIHRWLAWACGGAGLGVIASIVTGAAVIATPITILGGLITIGTGTVIAWPAIALFALIGGALFGLVAYWKHRPS